MEERVCFGILTKEISNKTFFACLKLITFERISGRQPCKGRKEAPLRPFLQG